MILIRLYDAAHSAVCIRLGEIWLLEAHLSNFLVLHPHKVGIGAVRSGLKLVSLSYNMICSI
jgi:hypothetical protein